MHEASFLQDLLVLFALGTFTVVLFHRISLPPVLGFLLTGLLCGPYGFGLVDSVREVEALAELGVVLLLFTIGIEFSFEKLKRARHFLLVGGSLQVLVTIALAALLSHLVGLPWNVSVFLGMLVSLSSTVLVVRLLQHHSEISSAHGTAAVSVLVFQDLCIVPMVLLVPFLGGEGGNLTEFAFVVGKAVLFLGVAVALARYMVPWLLDHVANTRKREAFVLSTMLLCLGMGWATSQVGLSLALGAFLAGLFISESKYSHQALGDILPFREVFNFLVFVSIGMLFDARTLMQEPLLIAACLIVLVLLKAAVTSGIAFGMGHSLRVSLLTGFALAQVSEFSFVLAKVGLAEKVWDQSLNQIFLAVAILSMALTPAINGLGSRSAGWLARVLPGKWTGGRRTEHGEDETLLVNHVIIVGYGVGGRALAAVLKRVGIPHVVVEHDPEIVSREKKQDVPIFYGDASSASVLEHARIEHARVIAVTIIDNQTAVRTAELARRLNPHVKVVARARMVDEVEALVKVGTHEVVAEEFVGSIEMFSRVLQNCMVPRDVIESCVQAVKSEWSHSCEACFEQMRPGDGLPGLPSDLRVEVHKLPVGSILVGKSLSESNLRPETGATVVAVHHLDGRLTRNPSGGTMLSEGDALVMLGEAQQLTLAETLINARREGESTG